VEELEALQKELFVKKNGFSHIKDGFFANRYLQVKTDAELDFKTAKQKPAPAAAPADLVHPALFEQLKKWRAETAEALGAERYQVMATRTLIDISNALPLNQPALLQIKGIGAVKSQQFGEALLAIVRTYCEAHRGRTGEAIGTESSPAPEKAPKVDSKLVSYEAFRAGKTLTEIAQERELARSTIEGHLAHYIGLGELDVFELLTEAQVHEIGAFLANQSEFVPSAAKEHFGEKYSYGEIKMVHEHLSRERQHA
jgi:Superfamily II DNA helicase